MVDLSDLSIVFCSFTRPGTSQASHLCNGATASQRLAQVHVYHVCRVGPRFGRTQAGPEGDLLPVLPGGHYINI